MTRGVPSSSAGRNAGRDDHQEEEHEQREQEQASNRQADGDAGGAAGGGEGAGAIEERTNYLVALAGMRALTSHVQDLSKGRRWTERVKGWEEKAGLTEPSVKLALGFLDILGVSLCVLYVMRVFVCMWVRVAVSVRLPVHASSVLCLCRPLRSSNKLQDFSAHLHNVQSEERNDDGQGQTASAINRFFASSSELEPSHDMEEPYSTGINMRNVKMVYTAV